MQDKNDFSPVENNFPDQVLVEKFIPGKELTTTVMDERTLVLQILLQIAGMIMNQSIISEAQSILSPQIYQKKSMMLVKILRCELT